MLGNNTNMPQHLKYILMRDYEVSSESVGIHGPMLYIFKMLSVKNAKKLELDFFVNQLPYITDLKHLPLVVCFERDKYWKASYK